MGHDGSRWITTCTCMCIRNSGLLFWRSIRFARTNVRAPAPERGQARLLRFCPLHSHWVPRFFPRQEIRGRNSRVPRVSLYSLSRIAVPLFPGNSSRCGGLPHFLSNSSPVEDNSPAAGPLRTAGYIFRSSAPCGDPAILPFYLPNYPKDKEFHGF